MTEIDIWTFLNSPLFALIVGTFLIPFVIKLIQKAIEKIKVSENRNLYGALIIYRYTELEKAFDYFINLSSDQITSDEGSKYREIFIKISEIFDGTYKSFIPSLDKENTFPELLLKFFGKKLIAKSSGILPPNMRRLLNLPELREQLDDIKLLINNDPQNTKHKQSYQKIQDDIKNLKPKIIRDKMKVIKALS